MRCSDDDVEVVLVTAPDAEVAAELARAVVADRLAACVNVIGPVRSIYRWQGELQDDSEVLLMIKTTRDRRPDLAARVCELHPYEVPEVLALPATGGSEAYLRWVAAEVSG